MAQKTQIVNNYKQNVEKATHRTHTHITHTQQHVSKSENFEQGTGIFGKNH